MASRCAGIIITVKTNRTETAMKTEFSSGIVELSMVVEISFIDKLGRGRSAKRFTHTNRWELSGGNRINHAVSRLYYLVGVGESANCVWRQIVTEVN